MAMDIDRRSFCRGLLAFGCVSGILGQGDFAIAKVAAESEDSAFFLNRGIEFFDLPTLHSIRKADVDRLIDTPIKFPDWLADGLELTGPGGEKRRVRTCREYREALQNGYYAFSNFDIKSSYLLDIPNGVLLAAERGSPPQRSFFERVKFDNGLSAILSAEILNVSPDIEAPDDISLEHFLEECGATFECTSGIARVEHGGMGRAISEIMRADLNGDGLEEILVFNYIYAVGGTLGAGGLSILRRDNPDGLIKLAPWPDDLASGSAMA